MIRWNLNGHLDFELSFGVLFTQLGVGWHIILSVLIVGGREILFGRKWLQLRRWEMLLL
jgi:hypothetical protein